MPVPEQTDLTDPDVLPPLTRARRLLYRGRVGDYGLERAALPNGMEVELEILRHPGAAAVVPLHADGTVTLIRQHRHAVGGMIYEIPAGKLERGEDPAACAARELREETGLIAATLRPLMAMRTAPAYTDEVIHLYAAAGLSDGATELDEDEVLHPLRLPLAEAIAMITSGQITDAKSVCALLLVASGA